MSDAQYDDELFEDGIDEEQTAHALELGIWKRLFAFTKPYRKELIALIACGVGTAIGEASFPMITRAVIDDVGANGMDANLWGYAGLYGVLVFALALGTCGFLYFAEKIRTYVSHDIRHEGFGNLQQLSFSYYDYRPVGWLMARMTSDCDRLTDILAWGILDLFWGTFIMIAIMGAMLVMEPMLALGVIVVVPALFFVSKYFQKRILISSRAVRRSNSKLTGNYNESIMGVRTTKAFVREPRNLEEFSGESDSMYRNSMHNALQNAIYLPIVLTLGSLATGLVLVYGGMEMIAGAITAGTLIAFIAYTRQFFEPVQVLAGWLAEMQMAQASAERVMELLETKPSIGDDAQVTKAIERHAPVALGSALAEDGSESQIREIELRDVGFEYAEGEPVLEAINLKVSRGETLAIVGPTGGGKSTLVNVICRFYEPTTGDVLINGEDYRQRSLRWLQSSLGMVLQSSTVFSGTIEDNIRYGRIDATAEEIVAAAKVAGAHDLVLEKDDGYATKLGEGGQQLSAGEKQLISFARAVLADPQILVMDEATSSVDTETEARIQAGLDRLLEGRIAFVIAHRLSTIRAATRILVVNEGRITEQGTHSELLAQRGHYFQLYQMQSVGGSGRARGWMES